MAGTILSRLSALAVIVALAGILPAATTEAIGPEVVNDRVRYFSSAMVEKHPTFASATADENGVLVRFTDGTPTYVTLEKDWADNRYGGVGTTIELTNITFAGKTYYRAFVNHTGAMKEAYFRPFIAAPGATVYTMGSEDTFRITVQPMLVTIVSLGESGTPLRMQVSGVHADLVVQPQMIFNRGWLGIILPGLPDLPPNPPDPENLPAYVVAWNDGTSRPYPVVANARFITVDTGCLCDQAGFASTSVAVDVDTDGDLYTDNFERAIGLNHLAIDSDSDGVIDRLDFEPFVDSQWRETFYDFEDLVNYTGWNESVRIRYRVDQVSDKIFEATAELTNAGPDSGMVFKFNIDDNILATYHGPSPMPTSVFSADGKKLLIDPALQWFRVQTLIETRTPTSAYAPIKVDEGVPVWGRHDFLSARHERQLSSANTIDTTLVQSTSSLMLGPTFESVCDLVGGCDIDVAKIVACPGGNCVSELIEYLKRQVPQIVVCPDGECLPRIECPPDIPDVPGFVGPSSTYPDEECLVWLNGLIAAILDDLVGDDPCPVACVTIPCAEDAVACLNNVCQSQINAECEAFVLRELSALIGYLNSQVEAGLRTIDAVQVTINREVGKTLSTAKNLTEGGVPDLLPTIVEICYATTGSSLCTSPPGVIVPPIPGIQGVDDFDNDQVKDGEDADPTADLDVRFDLNRFAMIDPVDKTSCGGADMWFDLYLGEDARAPIVRSPTSGTFMNRDVIWNENSPVLTRTFPIRDNAAEVMLWIAATDEDNNDSCTGDNSVDDVVDISRTIPFGYEGAENGWAVFSYDLFTGLWEGDDHKYASDTDGYGFVNGVDGGEAREPPLWVQDSNNVWYHDNNGAVWIDIQVVGDQDGDGLSLSAEQRISAAMNPRSADSDLDGMNDRYEWKYNGVISPTVSNCAPSGTCPSGNGNEAADPDMDGLPFSEEEDLRTIPMDHMDILVEIDHMACPATGGCAGMLRRSKDWAVGTYANQGVSLWIDDGSLDYSIFSASGIGGGQQIPTEAISSVTAIGQKSRDPTTRSFPADREGLFRYGVFLTKHPDINDAQRGAAHIPEAAPGQYIRYSDVFLVRDERIRIEASTQLGTEKLQVHTFVHELTHGIVGIVDFDDRASTTGCNQAHDKYVYYPDGNYPLVFDGDLSNTIGNDLHPTRWAEVKEEGAARVLLPKNANHPGCQNYPNNTSWD